MEKEIKNLEIEEVAKEHEAKLVRYGLDFGYTNDPTAYESGAMYVVIEDKKSDFILGKSRVFKIVIPATYDFVLKSLIRQKR